MTKSHKDTKDCMFQYAYANGFNPIKENTDLISKEEADALVEKWLPDLKDNWDDFHSPQMCIWINCSTSTDYNKTSLSIDYRDCEMSNGHFYRVEKKMII